LYNIFCIYLYHWSKAFDTLHQPGNRQVAILAVSGHNAVI